MYPLIDAKKLEKIPYLDNLPVEGGELQYLTPEEYQAKFACEYTESVVVKQLPKEPITASDFRETRAKAVLERLQQPLETLVICKMSPEVGYGLFTLQPIKAGTVLCLYTGEYDPKTAEFVYSYGNVNAARVGGLARFMQHQPISQAQHKAYLMQSFENANLLALQENIPLKQAKDSLKRPKLREKLIKKFEKQVASNAHFAGYDFDQYQFKDQITQEQVAQSNIAVETTKVAGIELILMIASRDIKQYEMLGFSYGVMYWQDPSIQMAPLLFTRTGQPIDPARYHYKNHQAVDKANSIVSGRSLLSASMPKEVLKKPDKPLDVKPTSSKQNTMEELPLNSPMLSDVENALQIETARFFKKPTATIWEKRSQEKLAEKYSGHQMRFFSLNANEQAVAQDFADQLQKSGFDAVLEQEQESSALVVDLTTSKPSLG